MAITTQRAQELQELYEKLKVRVADIDDKYSLDYVEPKLDLPDSLNLVKLEYTPKTEEELMALAEQAVEAAIMSKQNSIERTFSAKIRSLALKLDKIKTKTDQANAEANEDYIKALDDIRRKLINNGLVFSSIGDKHNSMAVADYNKQLAKIAEEGKAESNFVKQEQLDAESLYFESCAALEKEKQTRIADKLQNLKDDEEKLRISIEKYNNSLEEKEQKYQASRAKAYEAARKAAYERAYKNAKLYLETGETGYRQLIQREKYAVCQDMFYPLRREEAQFILSLDSFLVNHLGTYYSAFVDWVNTVLIP